MHLLILLFSLSVFAESGADDWKIIAESQDCGSKIQILAREGTKFVYATENGKRYKLVSSSDSAFSSKAMGSNIFTSDMKEKRPAADPVFTFIQPGQVESNPPKILVSRKGAETNCRMAAH